MNSINSLKKLPFFYILSMGRSGSTLLEFLLDAHPNVNIPVESRFIIHLYYKYGTKKQWSQRDKERFIKDLFSDFNIKNFWNIDKEKLTKEILETEPDVSFFDLCRIITANYISFYPKENITIQGSKNPPYGLWCDILYKLNKDSKFIHLIRNPMGFIASHKKLGHKNLIYFAYRWNLMNNRIESLKQKTPNNFITIKFEDLVNNPELTLIKICSFLEIQYYPKQLFFNERIKDYYSEIIRNKEYEKLKIFNSHLKSLVHPIDKSKKESWKGILNDKEKMDIAYITKDLSNIYGYNYIEKTGCFKPKFISAKLIVMFNHIRNRIFYRFLT